MKKIAIKLFCLLSFLSIQITAEESTLVVEETAVVQEAVKEPIAEPETPPVLVSEPAEVQPETRGPEVMRTKYETVFIKMMAILFLIALAAGFVVWLYRRFNFTKMHQLNYLRTIKVIEKRPLSPKTMLYLVEINGKQIMLAESQLEVRQVMEFDTSLERALAAQPEV